MDVTSRPRKIVYVTTDLRIGGAEAMLTRMAIARPPLADDITVVSLLPAEAYVDRLRAAGVTVVELGFDAVEHKVHMHDVQATILHLLGLDDTKLTFKFQGREFRLTDVSGELIKPLLA